MPLLVFQDEAELRFVGKIGTDKDPAQGIGVFAVKRLTILAIVSRLQADLVGPGLIAGAGGTNGAIIHVGLIQSM